MEIISFYNGCAINADQFAAVASFNADEAPDEPSGIAVLLSYAVETGWSKPVIIDDHRMSDVTILADATAQVQPIALSEDGFLFGFSAIEPLVEISGLQGISTRAFSRKNDMINVICNSGYFFEQASPYTLEFDLVTNQFIVERPAWGASRAEKRAYFRTQTHIMNAEASLSGRIAMTEISKVMVLEADLSMTEIIQPRIFVGVTFDPGTDQFWFCGHSPQPIVGREISPGVIETVFQGTSGSHTITDLALYQGDIYLADTNLSAGGLYVLSPEEDGTAYEFVQAAIPQEFGSLPVWKVDEKDGVLWVVRTKDLLMFDGEDWLQFPAPLVERS